MSARLADGGGVQRQGSPFIVAHRAGNDLARLRAAEQLGLDLVEADVRLFRGRLEVRHLKTIGPINVLWDRWELADPRARRLQLEDLLAATGPQTELMLDLKGRNVRVGTRALAAARQYLGRRRLTVCSRTWTLLEPFAAMPDVRVVHSVGSGRQLRSLLRRSRGSRLQGVSIHERLLDPSTVAELRAVADVVMTWPANALTRAHELLAMGVDGLITDRLDLAGELGWRP